MTQAAPHRANASLFPNFSRAFDHIVSERALERLTLAPNLLWCRKGNETGAKPVI
ncbi:hypothetical protein [Celeribacter marinus]|uniref:Uncharacterized protein n=1 Tax=Celeribacter marinus TaxID=1397108 RepID=A0A0N9ZIC6_9RHOB|nr:hypothetical protein [Celeribacter marinus]ALI56417.1 hypothetical protein IMCC12053_2470 [Celeribacter marinus]SFK43643.1 hypothetical protein SAMN05444421_104137 [Celeribacter marinus]